MLASTKISYPIENNFPTSSDEGDWDAVLGSPTLSLGFPPLRESSTDITTSTSSRPLASSDTSLDSAKLMDGEGLAAPWHASLTTNAPFDWGNWEDWMQWDEGENDATKSTVLPTARSLVSDINPLLSSISDDGQISNSPNSNNNRNSLGSIDSSIDPITPFVFEQLPFEYGLNDPLFALDKSLDSNVDLAEQSAGEFASSNTFPSEQFQFSTIPDSSLSLNLKQPPCQNVDFQNFNFSEQNLPSTSGSCPTISTSSPEQSPYSQNRKRKSSADGEDADLAPTETKRVLGRKAAHKMIEKKYRTNLNEKIAALRDSIPSLRSMNGGPGGDKQNDDDDKNLDDEPRGPTGPNKGVVLSEATAYIRHLEKRNKKLSDETAILKMRLSAFKTLAMTGPIGFKAGMIQNPGRVNGIYADEARQPYQVNTRVVDQAKRLNRNARSIGKQANGSGGLMSKLMVGSLAGFMIIQGFSEKEESENTPSGRGLFGLPTQYMGSMRQIVKSMHSPNAVRYMSSLEGPLILLKAILFIGAILYVIYPSFFDSKAGEEAKPRPDLTLTAAPSLASPVEVRRSAWLTAVQTVWVPRRSFLLQIIALALKSLKLCLGNAIGWHRYAILTGTTEDQEAARVKAWEIALDAQLAGGDADISIGRLILTLIASGTLPPTPHRHMLKALHIHVLLWDSAPANGRLAGWNLCRSIAKKFAKWQWEKARKLQKQAGSLPPSSEAPGLDRLPDYLARLLELDSDAVMVDAVVQRAYNLAWNKPTAHEICRPVEGMGAVVEDPAIRSPLDALAGWYSSLILHKVLAKSLEARTMDPNFKNSLSEDLEVALRIAPTASLAQSRSLVARAVLLEEGRGANIAAALQVLPKSSFQSRSSTALGVEIPSSSFVTSDTPPDLVLALRCAMASTFLKRPSCKKTAIALSETLRFPPNTLSFLGFTALYHFLDVAFQEKEVAIEIKEILENTAGTLKIWIVGEQGKSSGLGKEDKVNVTTLCVDVFGWLIGMRDERPIDPVYGIMSCE